MPANPRSRSHAAGWWVNPIALVSTTTATSEMRSTVTVVSRIQIAENAPMK